MAWSDPDVRKELDRTYRLKNADRLRTYRRAWYASRREKEAARAREWRAAHPEAAAAARRKWYATHIETARVLAVARINRAREAGKDWQRMDPWPADCQVCGRPIDPRLKGRQSAAETLGHEPPVSWLKSHPEYAGPLLVRPEHYGCNTRKSNRPDWEPKPPRKASPKKIGPRLHRPEPDFVDHDRCGKCLLPIIWVPGSRQMAAHLRHAEISTERTSGQTATYVLEARP